MGNIITGNTSMLILELINQRDMYGYELMEELKKRSEGKFTLKAGTLYPLLHNMEKEGIIEAYSKEYRGKNRNYYKITTTGKKELEKQKQQWEEFYNTINNILGGNDNVLQN